MPINFFRRSKKEKEKASKDKVEPNEGASYNAGESSRRSAQYNPPTTEAEYQEETVNYNPATKAEYKWKTAQSNPFTKAEYHDEETAAQYNPATKGAEYNKYKEEESHPVAAAADDPYAFLSDFDTVFLIDDSGSMSIGKRWDQTRTALEAIVPICTAHDADGIDIYFLNNNTKTKDGSFLNVTSLDAVKEIFGKVSPCGGTPTGKRLGDIISPYLQKLGQRSNTNNTKIKPLNIIVITDGCPTDEQRLESVIVEAAKKLDVLEAPGWQVGVQFFQVGGDKGATRSLMLLDDKLKDKYKIRDMVDTVPWKEEGSGGSGSGFGSGPGSGSASASFDGAFILKVVTGAVNRRLDRKVV